MTCTECTVLRIKRITPELSSGIQWYDRLPNLQKLIVSYFLYRMHLLSNYGGLKVKNNFRRKPLLKIKTVVLTADSHVFTYLYEFIYLHL